mgnify:CR=1 FL=1
MHRIRAGGFTLVELMVAVAVLAILVSVALPSFRDFGERSALRGAADAVTQVIGTARTEAIKRNQLVRVEIKQPAGGGFCIGAATVASTTAAGCDCSTAACPVAEFPSNADEIEALSLAGTPSFGVDTAFVVDPATGMLSDAGDAGSVEFSSPRGFGVRLAVNPMGRVSLCTPTGVRAVSGVDPC